MSCVQCSKHLTLLDSCMICPDSNLLPHYQFLGDVHGRREDIQH